MIEVLCARTPAVLHSPVLKTTLAFYRDEWKFSVQQHIPGVLAILTRESVTVQLWQRRADMVPQTFACRLMVDHLELWLMGLQSAPSQTPQCLTEQAWGYELALSDCDGNRLQLVQSAPHALKRKLRT